MMVERLLLMGVGERRLAKDVLGEPRAVSRVSTR